MADLSFLLNRTANKLDEVYSSDRVSFHKYLGIGEIGGHCARSLWYGFRNYLPKEPISGRTARIFETGHAQEQRIIAGLQKFALVGNTQQQVSACNGHLVGYTDFDILGIPEAPATVHQGEAKSMNDKNFKLLKSKGVREAQFKHFTQFTLYAHLRGLSRYFYIAINKDNEDVHVERGEVDNEFAKARIGYAQRIIDADKAPTRISEDPEHMSCKWCPYRQICHFGGAYNINIRNDGTHRPSVDGTWVKI